ncbi:MAG: hypothetical protein OXE57_13570 [Alphaproteobacteria bacterium]|nr:hypothetical protein [Alphaproteobacteria bacterium]
MPRNTSSHYFYDVAEMRLSQVVELLSGGKARQLALRTASGNYVDIIFYASDDWTDDPLSFTPIEMPDPD